MACEELISNLRIWLKKHVINRGKHFRLLEKSEGNLGWGWDWKYCTYLGFVKTLLMVDDWHNFLHVNISFNKNYLKSTIVYWQCPPFTELHGWLTGVKVISFRIPYLYLIFFKTAKSTKNLFWRWPCLGFFSFFQWVENCYNLRWGRANCLLSPWVLKKWVFC